VSNVVAVAGGRHHTIAARADGTVICWGDNSQGQCNVPTGLTASRFVAAGRYHSLAILYTPPSGLPLAESQVFTSESQTSIALPARIALTDLGNGSFRIRLHAMPRSRYTLEVADGLFPTSWQTMTVLTTDNQGGAELMDTPPPGITTRYYRTVYRTQNLIP
jgi:hypothetical protein